MYGGYGMYGPRYGRGFGMGMMYQSEQDSESAADRESVSLSKREDSDAWYGRGYGGMYGGYGMFGPRYGRGFGWGYQKEEEQV